MLIPFIELEGQPDGDGAATTAAAPSRQGRREMLEIEAAVEVHSRCGEILVVDSAAPGGTTDNLPVLRSICRKHSCRVGGTMGSAERGRAILRAGAARLVISDSKDSALLGAFRPEHVVLAIDLADESGIVERIGSTERQCGAYLLRGTAALTEDGRPDIEMLHRLSVLTRHGITVSAGSVMLEDVTALDALGIDVVIEAPGHRTGPAPVEAFVACIRWDRDGTVPTVVQDPAGQVLMVNLSSRDSLTRALRSGEGTYFSQARGGLWRKGERTGHDQLVLRCRASCDRRALLFTVRQAGVACERGSYSCFGVRDFGIGFLGEVTSSKRAGDPASSYTARLLSDPDLLAAKMREKAAELGMARDGEEAKLALADIVYFLVVEAVSKGLSWEDIILELRGRQR